MKKFLLLAAAVLGVTVGLGLYQVWNDGGRLLKAEGVLWGSGLASSPSPSASNAAAGELPQSKMIEGLAHVGQTFNNCSSVGLMIAMSHWGIRDTQEAIAEGTRPWNNPRGDNDDKSVNLYELAEYAEAKHGLATYVRPNGSIELLKKFVANDIPVIGRALMYEDDDIVHYRVIRGYDESVKTLYESDGIEGPKVPYTYDKWMYFWKDFNYSYLIVVPDNKKALVEEILGEETDEKTAWQNAKARAERELAANPSDVKTHFNLVTALYYLGDYAGTVREFEKIESQLSRRKLWYQHEPIQAYFELKNYDRVLALTEHIINDNNKSVSELYYMRGKIFETRGDTTAAKAEYEKAVMYNKHYKPAKDALAALQ